ncbi:MAG: glutathione S-transferase [Gammaproteobacteria bacterium]|nr:MAG: glutathione S-transferase [Gammaproteobacteria bacterium]
MNRLKIYGDKKSGNCYKIQLTCSLLGIEYEWIDIDILAGDTQCDSFLSKNPAGKIPLLELDDGRHLSESNAIINYLANGSNLLPTDDFLLAKVQQWQFFEQYSHEPYIAVARFIQKYLNLPTERLDEYRSKQIGGHKALTVMNDHLRNNYFLVGNAITTADISLYAYTHVAYEGGFELEHYPYIDTWLKRIENMPNYVAMKQ